MQILPRRTFIEALISLIDNLDIPDILDGVPDISDEEFAEIALESTLEHHFQILDPVPFHELMAELSDIDQQLISFDWDVFLAALKDAHPTKQVLFNLIKPIRQKFDLTKPLAVEGYASTDDDDDYGDDDYDDDDYDDAILTLTDPEFTAIIQALFQEMGLDLANRPDLKQEIQDIIQASSTEDFEHLQTPQWERDPTTGFPSLPLVEIDLQRIVDDLQSEVSRLHLLANEQKNVLLRTAHRERPFDPQEFDAWLTGLRVYWLTMAPIDPTRPFPLDFDARNYFCESYMAHDVWKAMGERKTTPMYQNPDFIAKHTLPPPPPLNHATPWRRPFIAAICLLILICAISSWKLLQTRENADKPPQQAASSVPVQTERYLTIDAAINPETSPLTLVMQRKLRRTWIIKIELLKGPTEGPNVHIISDDDAGQGITIESDERPLSIRW